MQRAQGALAATTVSFGTPTTYPAALGTVSVAVGDFNQDGHADLVTTDGDAGVSLLLGNGDGTFQAPRTDAVGQNCSGVTAFDINRDGKLDIVTANFGSGTVSILLGNGDGTFQGATPVALPQAPRTVAVADLNHDGKPDIIAAAGGANGVSVLLGNGDGTFQTPQSYPITGNAWAVAVGDVNGDDLPDLVVTDFFDSLVQVLVGNGDGTFQPTQTYPLARYTDDLGMAVADINSDGRPDIVTNNAGGTVSALLNTTAWAARYSVTHLVGGADIRGINNVGQVVGVSLTTGHAALWQNGFGSWQNGLITDLGELPDSYRGTFRGGRPIVYTTPGKLWGRRLTPTVWAKPSCGRTGR